MNDRDRDLGEHIASHRAHARTVLALDEELGTHHGIDWSAFVLLDLLQSAGGDMPTAAAAATQGLTPTRLLLQVLPLEKLGLVRRTRAGDGTRQLAMAASGRRLLREAGETAEGVLASLHNAACPPARAATSS